MRSSRNSVIGILLVLLLVAGIWVLRSPEKPARVEKTSEPQRGTDEGAEVRNEDPVVSSPMRTPEADVKEEVRVEESLTEESVAEQLAWAKSRRARMKDLIRSDPEQALKESLSMKERAALPPEVAAEVEQVVSGKGFFGVLAVCGHGGEDLDHGAACEIKHEVFIDGKPYRAYVYGKRLEKMTTKEDSIYGVAVDSELALHEDTVVRIPSDSLADPIPEGAVAVMYEGETRFFDSEAEMIDWREGLE